MVALLTVIHILVAVTLVLIVLLQSGKGSDIAGAFGGMGSQAAFGPRGTATFLSKATIALAAVFMVTSISLSILASRGPVGGSSLLSDEDSTAAPPQSATPPASPAPASTPGGTPGVEVQGAEGASVTVETPGQPGAGAPAAGSQTQPAPAPPAPAAGQPAAPSGQ